ncbi:MAG: succinyldiaminopimelate transaminase [Gammaproteobacteria bacterium]|nr:MAG: succinyldiaminopimelate transaminase [Gammaproteobacteria bacterium]
MNSNLNHLHPYPFSKMATLLANVTPAIDYEPIKLGIGEPKHLPPQFVLDELTAHVVKVQKYPTTGGMPELSQTIADWLKNRFSLNTIDPISQVIPVMGTREAIFSFVQACIDTKSSDNTPNPKPVIVMPNPFYQIYEGAAILADAEPYYVSCTPKNDFKADYRQVPSEIWERTQLLFVCSPNNPTGSVLSTNDWKELIALSDKYNFIIASDECYSELYFDKPPTGLLEVCAELGHDDYHNCVVFHSLSKRSNLPGLRSGFIAGDANLLKPYLQYRTYQGCAMPIHHQYASIKAWQDEKHVEANRVLYREKFALWMQELGDLLELRHPDASFYFWVKVPDQFNNDDEYFVKELLQKVNIYALAGRYLSREVNGYNPGKGYVRLALVASVEESREAIKRIKTLLV